MKIIIKILLFPFAILIKTAAFVLLAVVKMSAFFAGPLMTFMIGCGLYSAYMANWKQAALLATAAGLVYVLYLTAGAVTAALGLVGDRLLL